jgi:hypothetical protein
MTQLNYQNRVLVIARGQDMCEALDVAGKDGWEAWALLGQSAEGLMVAIKRIKPAIELVKV